MAKSDNDWPMAFAERGGNLFGNPCLTKNRLTIQKKWADKLVNCTLHGVLNECGGCCHGKPKWTANNVYPMISFPREENQLYGKCGHFIEGEGCKWTIDERHTLCLLYPWYVKDGELVIWWRALGDSCRSAYKTQGTSIFVHFKDTWVSLFGQEQYDRVYDDLYVKELEASYFIASERFMLVHDKEMELCNKNVQPISRIEIWEKYFDNGKKL